MTKQTEKQAKQVGQVAFALPVNALEGMASSLASHFLHNPSALGDIQELTPVTLGRSDLFPCTKKKGWGSTLIVRVMPQQS